VTAFLTGAPGVLRGHPRSGVREPVLFTLLLTALTATVFLGFVSVAPNRLLSGRPVPLWVAAGTGYCGALAAIVGPLVPLCFAPPRQRWAVLTVGLAASWLVATLAALGAAAQALAAGAGPAARVSAGAAFWIMAGCSAFALADGLRRLRAGPVAAAAVALVLGGAIGALAARGTFATLSVVQEYSSRQALFAAALTRHIALVAGAVGLGLVIGLPLGLGASRRPRLQGPLFALLNLLQTVPSIALFGLLIWPLAALARAAPRLAAWGIGGIGPAPAVIALVLYALLPIVRNTVAGISGVDPAVVDAARGVGLTRAQIFRRVELPLSLPILIAGLRIVIVQTIGLAVVAALIGAGGLGTFVFEGLGQDALDLVLLGALPAIALALAADLGLRAMAALLPQRADR
jgi:osmoprotectant transport system permease protein